MNNQSRFVPTYAAFGGAPQYIQTPYGLVKNDASYKQYLAEKENKKMKEFADEYRKNRLIKKEIESMNFDGADN